MKRLLLSGLLAVTAHAVDVSGTYENLGSVLGATDEVVSLHGLLGLEFEPATARTLFAQTDRVVIRQSDSGFVIRCVDADGEQTWGGRWDREMGYDTEREQVKLLFSKRKEKTGYLFLLSSAGDRRLLVVEVHRVEASTFGPVGQPIGTYLFNRVSKITASRN